MASESAQISGAWPRASSYWIEDAKLCASPEAIDLEPTEPAPHAWSDLLTLGMVIAFGELPPPRRGRPRAGAPPRERVALTPSQVEARCLAFANEHGLLGLLDHQLVAFRRSRDMSRTWLVPRSLEDMFRNAGPVELDGPGPAGGFVRHFGGLAEWRDESELGRYAARGTPLRAAPPSCRWPLEYAEPLEDFILAVREFLVAFGEDWPRRAPGAPGLELAPWEDDEATVREERAVELLRPVVIHPEITRTRFRALTPLARLALDASAAIWGGERLVVCKSCSRTVARRSARAEYCSARCMNTPAKQRRREAAREAEKRDAARREALNRKRRDARAAKRASSGRKSRKP